jgi:hypothetical protein
MPISSIPSEKQLDVVIGSEKRGAGAEFPVDDGYYLSVIIHSDDIV